DSFEQLEELNRDHGARLHGGPGTLALREDVLGLVASWFPRPLRGTARRLLPASFDDELGAGLGLPRPPRCAHAAARGVLRPRGPAVRRMRPRAVAAFDDGSVRFRGYPGYPDGYNLSEIGAPDPPSRIDSARLARDVRRSG